MRDYRIDTLAIILCKMETENIIFGDYGNYLYNLARNYTNCEDFEKKDKFSPKCIKFLNHVLRFIEMYLEDENFLDYMLFDAIEELLENNMPFVLNK